MAPISPQALYGSRTFTVPTPHEFHYRRLRRLLVASSSDEMDVDETAGLLETKPIPKGVFNDTRIFSHFLTFVNIW